MIEVQQRADPSHWLWTDAALMADHLGLPEDTPLLQVSHFAKIFDSFLFFLSQWSFTLPLDDSSLDLSTSSLPFR
jgi:hypothetical protein